MNFHILTLFPEMVSQCLNTSILKRAADKNLISFQAINIRDFADNKHNKVDDYTYGGGAGMLMQAEPVYRAVTHVMESVVPENVADSSTTESESALNGPADVIKDVKKLRVIYVTPQGKTFNQEIAEELAKEENLIFLCGHYEGIDERVLQEVVTDYISIGDYVLTGGELPAMVMIDAISRLVPGVLNNETSAETESFQDGLLEYPQYSRPEEWHGVKVPAVLLSGDHKKIEKWRMEQSLIRTKERRPDLFHIFEKRARDSEKDLKKKKRVYSNMMDELFGETGNEN